MNTLPPCLNTAIMDRYLYFYSGQFKELNFIKHVLKQQFSEDITTILQDGYVLFNFYAKDMLVCSVVANHDDCFIHYFQEPSVHNMKIEYYSDFANKLKSIHALIIKDMINGDNALYNNNNIWWYEGR